MSKEFPSGVRVDYLRDGRIVVFTVSGMARQAVDDLFNTVELEIQRAIQEGRGFRVLYDLSPNLFGAVTPHARQRTEQASKDHPELAGYTAFIFPRISGIILQPLQRLITHDLKRTQPNMNFEIFRDRDSALAWLAQGL